MTETFSRRIARKSKKRELIIDAVSAAITSNEIFKTLRYKAISEKTITTYMQPIFLAKLRELFEELSPEQKPVTHIKKAHQSLSWEADVRTQIPNIEFLGCTHRPDFIVEIEGFTIAVEVKLGSDGASIRDGIGQSLVYSMQYDFVVYLLIDQTDDSKIRNSLNMNPEKSLIDSLWDRHNIRLVVR